MKKSFFGVLIILSVIIPSLAFSGDFDGLWATPDPSIMLMIRENSDMVLVMHLNLNHYITSSSTGYEVFIGTKNDTVISVTDLDGFSKVDAAFTAVLTSQTTANVTVNRCLPKYQGITCVFPTSATFPIIKIF